MIGKTFSSYINSPISRLKLFSYAALTALILSFFWLALPPLEDKLPNTEGIDQPATFFGNQVNDDLTHSFTKAIGEAKKSVLLIVYNLTDQSIIEALNKKSKEGIEVRIITDAKESAYVTPQLSDEILITRRFSRGRMHQKILVIDELTSWIGSANMTSDSLVIHGNLVTKLMSEHLSKHIKIKALTMIENGDITNFPNKTFIIGGQKIEICFLPDDQLAVNRIKELIASAKKTLRVAMFTWTRKDFAEELIKAANLGIDVEVVLDSKQGKGAGAKIATLLKNSPIKVSFSQGAPLLHHKFLYIDDKILVNGSANWTLAAFQENDESFVVFYDLTKKQQEKMNSLWKVISKESLTAIPKQHARRKML